MTQAPRNTQATDGPTPVGCTLGRTAAIERLQEWADIRRYRAASRPIPGGVELTLVGAAESDIVDIVQQEKRCCDFLEFSVLAESEAITLTITSNAPEAAPVIALLSGDPVPTMTDDSSPREGGC